jgi:uncharacterized protein
MEVESLLPGEKRALLGLARQALEHGVHGESLPRLDLQALSPALRSYGASFITLTAGGGLRGCVGTLAPSRPLAEDVRRNALGAALQDYRFPPVLPEELPGIRIEVSRLTVPTPLEYRTPEELLARLQPGLDGLVLGDGQHQATFLPQVWQKVASGEEFLAQLCLKMGLAADAWREKQLAARVYRVEEFHE